jgi:hypothetical protein
MSTDEHGYVVSLEAIDATRAAAVGGKAAHLGELTRIDGIGVPPGFCVGTAPSGGSSGKHQQSTSSSIGCRA